MGIYQLTSVINHASATDVLAAYARTDKPRTEDVFKYFFEILDKKNMPGLMNSNWRTTEFEKYFFAYTKILFFKYMRIVIPVEFFAVVNS